MIHYKLQTSICTEHYQPSGNSTGVVQSVLYTAVRHREPRATRESKL